MNIKIESGANVQITDKPIVNVNVFGDVVQHKEVNVYTEKKDVDAEDVEIEEESFESCAAIEELNEEELNYFAPTNSLQRLLKQPWFAEVRSDERYDTAWTDAFVEALMGSEYGEGIARDWAVQGLREKKSQTKGYVIGLLKDVGVLKGSYRGIASKVGIVVNEENKKDPYRTFADYMSRGKKQPYADWVKGYAMGLKRESE